MEATAIINFDDISDATLVTLSEDDNPANLVNVLALTCIKDDDIYKIAIPNVMVTKLKKEDLSNGESGAGDTGISETADEEKESSELVGEEDSSGNTSEDQGATSE